MKRALIALITALPLALGVAAAQGSTTDFPGFPGDGGAGTPQVAVAGTVVSVNATAGTFVANAYVVTPPAMGSGESDDSSGDGTEGAGFGGSGFGGLGGFTGDVRAHDLAAPTTTQVTITTNSSTTIHVDGVDGPATLGDLAAGARFVALFPGAPTDTLQTLVGGPATSVFAQLPKQFYAFVGTVTATDTTAGTVTVDVTRSLPSSLIVAGTSATFTVSSDTFVIGGSSLGAGFGDLFGGSLADVSTGDMVAGGLSGPAGLTAAQVGAMPLRFLLDLPAPATTSAGARASASRNALKETLKLLHGSKVNLGKSHGKKTHKAKKAKHTAKH